MNLATVMCTIRHEAEQLGEELYIICLIVKILFTLTRNLTPINRVSASSATVQWLKVDIPDNSTSTVVVDESGVSKVSIRTLRCAPQLDPC